MRFESSYWQKIEGQETIEQEFLHPCTAEEMGEFYPPADAQTAAEVERLWSGGHLYCFDWKRKPVELFGSWHNRDNFSQHELQLIPCANTGGDVYEWN